MSGNQTATGMDRVRERLLEIIASPVGWAFVWATPPSLIVASRHSEAETLSEFVLGMTVIDLGIASVFATGMFVLGYLFRIDEKTTWDVTFEMTPAVFGQIIGAICFVVGLGSVISRDPIGVYVALISLPLLFLPHIFEQTAN